MAERRLLVLGAGAHARAVADVALACGWTIAGFVGAPGTPVAAKGVVGSDDDLPRLVASRKFDGAVVGVGNAALARRPTLFARLRDLRIVTPSLVHPTAAVSPSHPTGPAPVAFPQSPVAAEAVAAEAPAPTTG